MGKYLGLKKKGGPYSGMVRSVRRSDSGSPLYNNLKCNCHLHRGTEIIIDKIPHCLHTTVTEKNRLSSIGRARLSTETAL